jgi:two-component system, sensor histidine kinase and response regulator
LRDQSLSERSREMASGIRSEVRSLMRLIMNLLDIAKSEEGRLSPSASSLDLELLAHDVLEAASVAAKGKGIKLERSLAVTRLNADSDLLRRVLENLLDNALRHAPEDSTIRLTSRAGQVSRSFASRTAGEGYRRKCASGSSIRSCR